MNMGPGSASPVLESAFRSLLLHQWAIVAVIFVVLLAAWAGARNAAFGFMSSGQKPGARAASPEPRARRLLRVGFGLLWLLDGLLQAQPQMPGGLADQVIKPSAATSPGWVRQLVDWGVSSWDYHPVGAAAAAVWIQVGLGLWLILAVRGRPARLAALSGVAWGLVVWVFGESFGGIFAPGLTILFGAPGAALLYVLAGVLVALPERAWDGTRLGRLLLGGSGLFFLGMTVLQAWPGRGFWAGTLDGRNAPVAAMAASMAGMSQPHLLASLDDWFEGFATGHGFAVNLVAVTGLGVAGAALLVSALLGRPRLALAAVALGAAGCVADWVLIQDFGFLGGLGTDPNSMVPLIALLAVGYTGLLPAPEPALETVADDGEPETPPPARPVPRVVRRFARTPARVVAGVGALGVILVGAVPMASAAVSRTADPIVARAIVAGASSQVDTPAPGFTLTSQDGQPVTLASLRGKVVLLTFLDPVGTTDGPLIAQELHAADAQLGGAARQAELVAVVANPTYLSTAYTRAFNRQEDLTGLTNWLYLTGSAAALAGVWHNYGMQIEDLPAGGAAAHNDLAFVIGADGMVRQELSDDPGPGTGATTSAFAGLLADSVLQTMGQS